jgi:hypothetical protein
VAASAVAPHAANAQAAGLPAANPTVHEFEHKHRQIPPPPVTPTTPNMNCTLQVPDHPLTAAGLATPYELSATDPSLGPCNEANGAQSAFVQAAILDPVSGAISIYNPLVIDRGTAPVIAPVAPTLPANAIVALWFGFNATNLQLRDHQSGQLADANCVNGAPGSLFSQYAYCNADAFYQAAHAALASGKLTVPALGTANDGATCPTTRDFFIVDQDQSDNLPATYLADATGRTAQDTVANRAVMRRATQIGNPSDNRLLDIFVDGALGCAAWRVPDLADPGQTVPGLPLNELQAKHYQQTPVALVPEGDPMTEENGVTSLQKVNLYRRGVDQPPVTAEGDADTARYCRQILRTAPPRLLLDQTSLTAAPTPDAAAANSLFTFLAQRLVASYQILNCQTLTDQTLPVSVVTNANLVAVSATVNQAQVAATIQALQPLALADNAADSEARSR